MPKTPALHFKLLCFIYPPMRSPFELREMYIGETMRTTTQTMIMENARRVAHKTDSYSDGEILDFRAEWDHILASQCRHPPSTTIEDDGRECVVCLFERELKLPSLPEMIFPRNTLEIRLENN
uniref:Uncharacterized protein n=1 Tax=Pristionchus pacificus TaxID=54126 RepID=A0A2A6CSB4_PRIPA|eukprot:PDM81029.1 hypothetical protein PRIPAC_36032 [Pristionchus pacificus]